VNNGKILDKMRSEQRHTFVAKGEHVKKNEGSWIKLSKLRKHSNDTKRLVTVLSANNLRCIEWCADAAFAVHPDHKSHPGAVMIMLLSSRTADPTELRRAVTGEESPPASRITLVSSGGFNQGNKPTPSFALTSPSWVRVELPCI